MKYGELELFWAIMVTIVLGILVILVVKLRQKHSRDIREMEERSKKKMVSTLNLMKRIFGTCKICNRSNVDTIGGYVVLVEEEKQDKKLEKHNQKELELDGHL